MRHAYGFEDVALVPGNLTINPDQTDIGFDLGDLHFDTPVLAAAMDAVVDVDFALSMSKHGGLGVLNLEGLQTRYADADGHLAEIAAAFGGGGHASAAGFSIDSGLPDIKSRIYDLADKL